MEKLSGYTFKDQVAETRKSIIYRAHNDEGSPVIIKLLKTKYPSPSDLARFKQEYEIIQSLDIEGIIKTHEFIDHGGHYAIVQEDFDGLSLKEILKKNGKLNIKAFLQIAIKLAETLGNLHKTNIIHRDIKPSNILINPAGGKVKITDFGISTILTRDNEEIYNIDVIEGTMAYMSPEQTGRMNRAVDYRTDLYSLGVTFYQMLAGSVPFDQKDPMEMIHSHIARQPLPVNEKNRAVPSILSDIILKLMSKTAEERYQNSFGLMADLQHCRDQLKKKGQVEPFDLARKDISVKFNIPQVLFGREKEKIELMQSFERVSRGSGEMVLVAGHPGIGKSALISEIHKPIVAKKGYFISGKYDQFRKDVPYSSIIQAFQGLVSQVLVQSDDMINRWRDKLNEALGTIGKVITDVIPDVELIIGSQHDVPELGPEESQNRFNHVFQNFVSVFTSEENPLALFLDDLQWADSASLKLIKILMTRQNNRFFLLMGAYRDNEVSEFHPLMITLDEIAKAGVTLNTIQLNTLDIFNVNRLIANALRSEENRTMALADLVHGKTNGNPFFISQFLKTLYDERMLDFDPRMGWMFDLERISNMQVTDNVVDLMADKISRMPDETVNILKICSCIGNRFDLDMLAVVSGESLKETLAHLTRAIDDGLVSMHGDVYRFHHDRIQEAAYSLIPEADRAKTHYMIGRNVLESTGEEELFEKVFYIVDQLNNGMELIESQVERTELARLNLVAGDKARKSTAYQSALNYLKMGIKLLSENCWNNNYDMTFELHRELMMCEYLTGDFERAVELFEIIKKNVKTVVDRMNAYNIMVILYTNIADYDEAIKLGLEGMKLGGYRVPRKPTQLHILIELIKLRWRFGRKKIEDVVDLPENKDPDKAAIGGLSITTGTTAFYVNTNLFALITIKADNLFLKYGNMWVSPFGWVALGPIVGSILGYYKHGYRFAMAALALNEKNGISKLRCTLHFLVAFFNLHWTRHVREDMQYLRDAYKFGLESGDMIYSGHSINILCMYRVMAGDNLDDVFDEYKKYEEFQFSVKDPFVASNYVENTQMYRNLKGLTVNKFSLNSEDYNEEEKLQEFREASNQLGTFYHQLVRIRIHYIYGNYRECLKIAAEMNKIVEIAVGNLHVPEFYFYFSLALAGIYKTVSIFKKLKYRFRLKLNQGKMKKWSRFGPENYLHKYLLVEAEKARSRRKKKKAEGLYDQAIASARGNDYVQNEAIANECAALYWLEQKNQETARRYMREAHHCYFRWGATAKVKELEAKYSELLAKDVRRVAHDESDETHTATSTSSSASGTQHLDIATIMKTSQALSGEIELDILLEKIIKLSIENAGAEKGILLLLSEGQLHVEAVGLVDHDVEVLQSIPVDEYAGLPESLVNYVNKTNENIVVSNACEDDRFRSDEYVENNQCKSVLCVPIMNKGKMSGILYLENNLTEDAFTPDSIELLQIIAAQAAISIENSRLIAQRENTAKLETEMKIAAEIQQALLPDEPAVPGFEITAYMEPADDVGGDYYDIINSANKDWVIIGDVSGHGVPAGLLMMMVQTTIQGLLREYPELSPAELLRIVNEAIKYNVSKMREERYMTITAFRFNHDGTGLFSGLHQDIFVYRAESGEVETVESDGIWLSPWDIKRPSAESSIKLNSADVMFIYTDGITEAMNSDKIMYGEERLIGVLKENGNASTSEIRDAVMKSMENYTTEDDVTMMILKKK